MSRSLSGIMLLSFTELSLLVMFGMTVGYLESSASEAGHTKSLPQDAGPRTVSARLLGLKGDLRRVAILVDESGSMDQGRRWLQVREVIEIWLEHLPIDEVAMILFSDSVRAFPEEGFLDLRVGAGNRSLLHQELLAGAPKGDTDTLLAFLEAYKYHDLDTIILFTDGFPDAGGNVFDENQAEAIYDLCRRHFVERQIRVNAVGVGDYFNKRLSGFLKRVSTGCGGSFVGF